MCYNIRALINWGRFWFRQEHGKINGKSEGHVKSKLKYNWKQK